MIVKLRMFIWTIETQHQPNRNSSTPSTSYLFYKQTSTRTRFHMLHLAAIWYLKRKINSTISKKIACFYQPVIDQDLQQCRVYLTVNYPGLATFRSSSKSKSNLMYKIIFQPSSLALFSKRARFYPQFTRMLCLSRNKAWSYTNTCAAVIVSSWVANP